MVSSGRRLSIVLALVLSALWGAQALAQNGFDIQQFHPLPGQQTNHFGVASSRVLEHLDFELGLLFDYADDPLVVVMMRDDERVSSLVSAQLTGRLMAAVGFFGWSELGIALPVILYQDGEPTHLVPDAPDAGFGLGDIRLVPRFEFFSTESDSAPGGVGLGLMANIWIPVGDSAAFQGEAFRIEPRLAFDAAFGRVARLSLNVGFLVRSEGEFHNIEITNALTAGLAASFALGRKLSLVPELTGSVPMGAEDIDTQETPLEALLGLKFFPIESLLLELGGGTGALEGAGTPDWRLFAGLSYSPPADPDRDGDGILNDEDGCPDDAEDFDGYQDEDGCPDPDNDGDGVLDVNDACPMDPEDMDGFMDRDGCPDPDNDGDGIWDIADGCPMDPEDVDTWQDEDGCPDPDNDGDGILDVNDSCPLDAETFNDFEDSDGCPDMVVVTCERIQLEETVYFDTDSDVIQQRSFNLLNEAAEFLNSRVDIRRVRVEGHTDSRASDEHNLDLSQRRAESVRQYLIDHGVAAERLVAAGFGEAQPIASNDTEEGQAQNRRVELRILAQDGCEDIQVPY